MRKMSLKNRLPVLLMAISCLGMNAAGCACERQSSQTTEYQPEGTRGGAMVRVPAGKFFMGCNEAVDKYCMDDEKPSRTVYLDAYYIDKYEVTNSRYDQCVADGKCVPPHYADGECYIFKGAGTVKAEAPAPLREADKPVVCVNWWEARDFCKWAGKRLPTEAEWEKAARGTDGRIYPWGDEWKPGASNYCDAECEVPWKDPDHDDGYRFTAPPGTFEENISPFGAIDMVGNVWEWCRDTYRDDSYKFFTDRDPPGPPFGYVKVIRGGGWSGTLKYHRTSNRYFADPLERTDIYGFRCAK